MGEKQSKNVKQDNEKQKALDVAISQILKDFGKGSIMKLGDHQVVEADAISTGSLGLDLALGVGGVPRGRIVEIFGPESAGKSTLAMHIAAEAQKEGGNVAYIDVEHALDPQYCKAIGVEINELMVSQPDTGEDALNIADTLIRSGAVDLVVIDSVAALVPRDELEGDVGDQKMALQARLMSHALRKITGSISKTRTVVIFINQLREKIGIVYGNPEVTPGGRALKFYASVRIEIKKIDFIKDSKGLVSGIRVRAKVVKNKVAPPFRDAEFELVYGKGINKVVEILDVATENGIIQKSGAFYSYKDKDLRLGQGKEQAVKFLEENDTILKEIKEKIKEKLNIGIKETS